MNNYPEPETDKMRKYRSVLIAAAVLVAACGGNTSAPTITLPEITVPAPVETATTTTSDPELVPVPEGTPTESTGEPEAVLPDTTPAEPTTQVEQASQAEPDVPSDEDDCAEGTHRHDDGCHADHPETSPEVTMWEEIVSEDSCSVAGGVWDAPNL